MDLMERAERLRREADDIELRANLFDGLIQELEDPKLETAVIFFTKVFKRRGSYKYTYAAVRFDMAGYGARWAVTGRTGDTGLTTEQLLDFAIAKDKDEAEQECWLATHWERLK